MDLARAFIEERLEPAGEMLLRSVVEGGGGVRFVTFAQCFAGIPVHLGHVGVAVAADGSVLAARAGELAPAAPRRSHVAGASADGVLAAARRVLGRAPDAALGPAPSAERAWLATSDGAVAAWRVDVLDAGRPDRRLQLVVGDADQNLLRLDSMTFPGVARARACPGDPSRGFVMVDLVDPATSPSVDSPAGWTDGMVSSGNNTFVQLDREGNFWPPYGAQATATGDPPVFDFPYTGDPRRDVDAALTNVFWAVNDAHDRFRRLGFDEASGACQIENFGRGGDARDDRVWALVQYDSQDGSVPFEGIFMGVGGDGTFTYVVSGVFEDASGTLRDGAFETDLLYHELAHQLSVRLVGNDAACMNGAQPQALAEGWSDFLAASFTNDPILGAWTSGVPGGVRSGPIGGTGVSYVNLCESGQCDRFRDGEIWAGMLWDIRSRLMQIHGAARGVEMAERLAVEGMRYTPCRPTFLDARDGLLLAEAALWGGSHRCDLWQLFVNRGLGASASTRGPDDTVPQAGYDMPPECGGSAALRLDRSDYAVDDDVAIELVDASAGASAVVAVASSGGDRLDVPVTRVGSGPLLRGSFRLQPGAVNPGDGVLQVAAGQTISVAAGPASDRATISDAMALTLLEHYVYGNWCQLDADDDAVDQWYILPRFLDPGEEGTIAVAVGNGLDDALEDLEVQVTSLSPLVRTLPTTPLRLGTVGPQEGTGPRRFDLEFRATASTAARPGDRADLRLDFRSRGRSGSLVLTLELAMDYVVETGLSPFDGGTETFDAATSSTLGGWSSTTPRGTINSWQREECAGRGSPFGWHVGQAGCADYGDGQVATTLISPPLFSLPPDAVAYRLRDWSFSIDSDLYTDPANPFCEADFVGLFVTLDPSTFDYGNPEIIYGDAQRWWRPLYEDTGGWTTQSPSYYSREPQFVQAGIDYAAARLMWVFWGDVYDCGFELANQGRFMVDDVRFTYEIVRKIPETAACTADCVVRAPLAIDPAGPKCDGEAFTLRAAGWEQIDCAGQVYFSFGGPGVPPASGWTTTTEAPATGVDGGYYSLYAQCETDADCHDYEAWTNESPAPPSVGTMMPGTLRVAREAAGDVVFRWLGAAAPPSYGIWRATTRAQLVAGFGPSWSLVGRHDGPEGLRGENAWRADAPALAPTLGFFRVAGRNRCTDAPNR